MSTRSFVCLAFACASPAVYTSMQVACQAGDGEVTDAVVECRGRVGRRVVYGGLRLPQDTSSQEAPHTQRRRLCPDVQGG
eukprot:29503-Eustigmatos_ZCMA.PRE.1